MNNSNHTENHAGNVFILTAGILTAAIGFLALLGWILRFPLLTNFGSNLIPMAPSTAFLLVLFGAAIFFRNRFPRYRGTYLMSIFIGSVVTVTSLLLFFFSSAGTYPQIEHLGLSITGTLDGMPIGHMSPIVTICFVVSAMSFLLTLSPSVERPKRAVAALVLACLMVLTASLHLIAYLIGSPFMHGGRIIPPSLPCSLAFLILALGLLVTAGLQIWPYSRIRDSATARVSYALLLIFVILAAGIVTGGYFTYRNYEKGYRQEIEHELSVIAELKVNQLVQYRAERLGDASILFKNPSLSNLVRRFFGKANDVDAQHQLQDWLGKYKSHYQYNRIFLLDTLGVTRMSVPKEQEPIASTISNRASEILISREVAIQDFYRNENDRKIYLSVLVPILDEQHSNRPIGILVLEIDPANYLYPFIQYWPIPSRTSETLIIRREGNDALFLNELRFQKNTALTLRSPLTNVTMPAVQAILGKEGTVEGIDYRGVPVLANVRHIPDSPWFLVARMNISEIYVPMRGRFWQIILFIGVLLIGTGAGVGLVWRHQRAHFYREKFLSSEALRVSEEKYRSLVELLPDGVVVHSQGTIVYANPSCAKIIGAESPEELVGTPVMDFVHPDYREIVIKRIKQALSEGSIAPVMEEHLIRLDGSLFTAEVSAVPISYGDKPAMLIVFNDITKRKQAEIALRVLSIRQEAILSAVPDIIMEVDNNKTYTWANQPGRDFFGDDVIGREVNVFFEGEQEVYNVVQPLFKGDEKVIHIDSWQRRKDGEKRLLSWLCRVLKDENGNTTGALSSARDITERRRAEELLRSSELSFATVFNSSPISMAITRLANNQFIDVNNAWQKITGYSREAAIGRTSFELNIWADPLERDQLIRMLGEQESVDGFVCNLQRKNGDIVQILFSASSITSAGEPCMLSMASDISERKRIEEELRESEERYRTLVNTSPYAIFVHQDGRFVFANVTAIKLFGAAKQEDLIGKSILDIVHPAYRNIATERIRKAISTGEPLPVMDEKFLRLDGSSIDVEVSAASFRTGGSQVMQVIARDITDRKIAEEIIKQSHIQLEQLSRHLVEAIENERTRISRELHDELGQSLTALKIDLNWLRDHPSLKNEIETKLERMIDIVNSTIKDVQTIASELRPNILEDLGLLPAIEWYCEEFEKRTGIRCETDLEEIHSQNMQLDLTLFRVTQEALTNAVRHANATTVEVKLHPTKKGLMLEIIDNGIGIDENKISSNKSLGIIGMRERIRQFNGSLEITSLQPKGTNVTVLVQT